MNYHWDFLRRNSSIIAILLAGISWGCISLFVRHLNACGMTSPQLVIVRSWGGALMMGGFLAARSREKFRIRWRDLWMFAGTGIVSLFFFNFCYFYVISHGYAAVGGVLLYTSPAFILLISALLFHEKITHRKLMALFLTLLGCVLISGLCTQSQRIPMRVLANGIGAGFLYALYSIFGKFALRRYDSMTVTFYTFLCCAVACLFSGNLSSTFEVIKALPEEVIPWGVGFAFFSAALPYFFYTWGLQRTSAGRAAILVAVEPLVCAVLGMCVYGEAHSPMRVFGVVCILFAILTLSRSE